MDFDIKRVAKIARLDLTETEAKRFEKDLNDIIEVFSNLDKIKTRASAVFQPMKTKNVMRKDEIATCLTQEEALSNTKYKERGFFKGPRII
ncbi:MAG: Asp-tRNA(Asn)/Glu-tRNA(Gln) amidotransferase subunit GatC [Candidatus Aenigmatarchaeota archaeon]